VLKDLRSQLQQALTDNSHLKKKLKDEHQAAMMQKQKELSDARQEAATANQKLEGCRVVIDYLHALLFGKFSLQVFAYPPCNTIWLQGARDCIRAAHCHRRR
jgi:hypothetical protein